MQQDSEALNLEQALGVLRRRVPLIAICVVVVAGAAFGFSKRETKKYTASASLAFNQNTISQQIAGLQGNVVNSSNLLAQQDSDIELVKGGEAAAKTAKAIGNGLTPEAVASSVSVAGQGESGIVIVSSTTTSPALAAEIANTYVSQFVMEQASANRQFYRSALAVVHKQLAHLSPQQRIGADGLDLQDRAQTLSLLSELKEGNVEIAAGAAVPASPSSPKTSKDTVLGIALGLVIGLGAAFMLERLDRRIRRPEELEAIYRLPALGAVPKSSALSRPPRDRKGKVTVLPPAVSEAFSLIRAHLRFFNVDRELRTVLIASAAPGDGKTTISRHLAEAAARLGSSVLLIEVDLRRPTLAGQLGIQAGPGLTDVLIGAMSMSDATQSVELEAAPGEGAKGRRLDVLVAGAILPPNPAELLESGAMEAILAQARFGYDLIVVDTPPLNAVSDAFPLLTKVDGVVLVGWLGRSRRDAAEQLYQVLASSGSPVLGVIANGAKSGGPPSYAGEANSQPAAASISSASSSEQLVPTAKS